jgi:hypothetical protein
VAAELEQVGRGEAHLVDARRRAPSEQRPRLRHVGREDRRRWHEDALERVERLGTDEHVAARRNEDGVDHAHACAVRLLRATATRRTHPLAASERADLRRRERTSAVPTASMISEVGSMPVLTA